MTAAATSPTTYPVNVRFDRDQRVSRLWGIPFLGWFVRGFILIPHYVILGIYGFFVSIAMLVTWIPVLLTGRFPGWGYALVGGYVRWSIRVTAYMLLMVGPYPPFSTSPGYPVEVDFDRTRGLNNLWGLPLVGILIRSILVIPHAIALWFVGIAAGFVMFFSWIPVLIFGRYPGLGYELVGGYLRWTTRVSCWILLMAGPYPPFRLGE